MRAVLCRPEPASGVLAMTGRADEHERTMAFAEIALGQIKALRQPATPRNYEIWYTYATGYHPALNAADQRDAQGQGHAHRSRSRPDLRHLPFAVAADRAHRQGRQPGHGRDRSGHGDDRRRRRHREQLHRKPRRRDRAARLIRRTAKACAPSSKAWCRPPRRWSTPTSSWKSG